MSQLRKTGIRSPWMPAPLQESLERVLPAIVVSASIAMPGASVWMARPLDAGVVQQPDRLAQTTIVVNRPVAPVGTFTLLFAPRVPNTDPLRPTVVVAEPPDSTLAQPSTTWIGRLSRPEDINRPTRPLTVVAGAQPQPGAIAQLLYAPRDQVVAPTDRAWPAMLVSGQQPIPGARVLVGRPLAAGEVVPDPTIHFPTSAVLSGNGSTSGAVVTAGSTAPLSVTSTTAAPTGLAGSTAPITPAGSIAPVASSGRTTAPITA